MRDLGTETSLGQQQEKSLSLKEGVHAPNNAMTKAPEIIKKEVYTLTYDFRGLQCVKQGEAGWNSSVHGGRSVSECVSECVSEYVSEYVSEVITSQLASCEHQLTVLFWEVLEH